MVRGDYADNWGLGKAFAQSKMFQFCQVKIPIVEALQIKLRQLEGLTVVVDKPPEVNAVDEQGTISAAKLKTSLHLVEPGDGLFAIQGNCCVNSTPEAIRDLIFKLAHELQSSSRGPLKVEDPSKSTHPISLIFLRMNAERLPSGTVPFRPSFAIKKCAVGNCQRFNAGRGFCKAHGGGIRCKTPGCQSSAKSMGLCKSHGGGKRCHHPSCGKSAKEPTNFCYRHGGGNRCIHEGCGKIAMRTSGFCVAHGGGRECAFEGCNSCAQMNGLCIKHGGGRRCTHPGCTKSARGPKMLCTFHGGGPRCSVEGCDKAALLRGMRNKDGPPKCFQHGGGKRCKRENCHKLAVGHFCLAHGGGIRCEIEGCLTAARSSKRKRCWRHLGDKKVCHVENCVTLAKLKGMCVRHYNERMPTNLLSRSKQLLVSSEHILYNHKKIFLCHECGQQFAQPGLFRDHQLREHLNGDDTPVPIQKYDDSEANQQGTETPANPPREEIDVKTNMD